MATLVRWMNMLSSSLVLGVYFTVQKRQNPSLYLKHTRYLLYKNYVFCEHYYHLE